MRLSKRVGVAIGTLALATGIAAGAPGASASTVKPFSAQSCSGDVCMYLSTPSGGHVTLQGWAYNVTFYGTLYFTGPNGMAAQYGPTQYTKGKGFYSYVTWPAVVGQYCVTGWSPDNHTSGRVYEGKVCNNVE